MDFEPRYTPEQQEFRQQVKDWLVENVPDGLEYPADSMDLSLRWLPEAARAGTQAGLQGLAVADRTDRVWRGRPLD